MLSRLLALILLLSWAALIGTGLVEPSAHVPLIALLDVRSLSAAVLLLARMLFGLLRVALWFAPLGAFAVFLLPDLGSRLARLLLVFLPGCALAVVVAWLGLAARAGSAPGPFELLLPAVGIVIGAKAALAWRRGWGARVLFLPSLVAQAAVLLLIGFGLLLLALQPQPAVGETVPLTSAEKRELVERFQGMNPRKIPPGETRSLQLSGRELARLADWVALSTGARLRPRLELAEGGLSIEASARVPRTSRWLNLRARTRAGIDAGRIHASGLELGLGQLRVPGLLLDPLTPLLVAGLAGDRDLRAVLPAVESLAFTPEAMRLAYTRVDMPPGLIARLVWGEEAQGSMRALVYAHVDRLLGMLDGVPRGDLRFARALETSFAAARQATAAGASAVEQNRAAIVALGIVLGHPRLARSVGERLDDARSDAALRLGQGTTLRGRADWTRHFSVSGALTVLSSVSPSDAAGLLKEELDADGGSGFSFGDLTADRAGTRFAEVATRDEASARRIQERLAGGFRVDDFFPPAADLPEGIPDAELQSRYGGVGGALYRMQAREIERRLALCAAYRDAAPPPAERTP